MSARLIVSLDYEVFGDGSGSIDCCVLAPAERIRQIVESVDAKLSVFVDALEFKAMHDNPETRGEAEKVISQLQEFVSVGHRVELHLHPQWMRAEWLKGRWNLDFSRWRIGNLTRGDIRKIVYEGINWLTEVVSVVQPDYELLAFRAGGWCVQPSEILLQVLADTTIRVESSVAPGMTQRNKVGWYDFRHASDKPCWRISDDVCKEDVDGVLWQVPIAVGCVPRLHHLQQVRHASGSFATGCAGTYDNGSSRFEQVKSKIYKMLALGNAMLDYSVFDAATLAMISNDWVTKRSLSSQGSVVPLVAIGHTKNFTESSAVALGEFLSWVSGHADMAFSDYQCFLKEIDVNDSS